MRAVVVGAFLVGCLAWSNAPVQAGFVLTNNIDGTDPSASNPFTAGQVVDPNITVTGIGRGPGILGSNANDRYNARGWTTAASVDISDYFTFTLAPNSGYAISFSDFVYTGQMSAAEGPVSFAFRSSIDGFSTNLGTATSTGATIDLSTPEFQSLLAPIEFRFYGWGAISGLGTFSINDFSFNGTVSAVSAVPEPSSIACIALAGIFGAARCLMRRR